jgi:hypothetical protein
MSFGKMFAGFGSAAGQAGMQGANPLLTKGSLNPALKAKLNPQAALKKIVDSKQGGMFDGLFDKMDKNKMRETGVGLINQALQQGQQGPQGPTIAPFQPGGGGGMPAGGGMPQLVALAQQLGLNRVL